MNNANLTTEQRIQKAISQSKQERNIMPSNSLRIGVWGPTAAGKTTYIVTVWGACLTPNARWFANPDDESTSDFVIDKLSALREGIFPEANKPQPKPNLYSYHFAPRQKNLSTPPSQSLNIKNPLDSFITWVSANDVETPVKHEAQNLGLKVSFTDAAGESYLKESLDTELWDNIWDCDGIVCLLDPAEALDHFKITLKLVQNLRLKAKSTPGRLIGNYLPQFVAVCYSKIDRPEYIGFKDKPEELNIALANKTGIDLYAILGANFMPERIKFFSVSAIGVDENGKSLVIDREIKTPQKIRPINVISPLRWLFESLSS